MRYLTPKPFSDGTYPSPQSTPFKGTIPLTDEQAQMVVDYNGFVTITSHEEEYEEGFFRTVYTVEPDLEAWEAWKAEHPPEPNPTEPEQFATYNELASAIKSGVNNIL